MATELTPDNRLLDIESKPLIARDESNKTRQWSTFQLIIFIILTAIISCLASNMDRIINTLRSKSNGTNDSLNTDNDRKYDIMVIGGGISGLSVMHFIASSPKYTDSKILLIEKLNRVGGRAFSYKIKYNDKTINCEGGAMRCDINNYYFGRILHRLDKCDDVVLMEHTSSTLSAFRNSKIRDGQTEEQYLNEIFNFNPEYDMDGLSVYTNNDLLVLGWNDILSENNNGSEPETEEEWIQMKTNWTLNGELLQKWSMETFMKYYMNVSVEWWDYQQIIKTGGTNFHDSVLNIMYKKFGPYPFPDPNETNSGFPNGLYTLKDGYNDITWALYENITQSNENHEILLGQQLISVDYSNLDDYRYIVRVMDLNNDELIEYYTNKLILSINAGSLKNILPNIKPIYNDYVENLVNSVELLPAYKINLIFDDEWIVDNIVIENSFVTDMPITRYMFSDLWTNGSLVALHIYAWSEFRTNYLNQLQQLGYPDNLYQNDEDIVILNNFNENSGLIVASVYLVEEVMKELKVLTNYIDIPYPIAAFAHPMNWNYNEIMEGGYQPKYGYESWDNIMSKIMKPMKNEDIYVSACDYSYESGFHYGGIQVGIDTAKKYFDVDDPFIDAVYCRY